MYSTASSRFEDDFPNNPIAPLLESTLSQANLQGAYLYRFDRDTDSADLILWAGLAPSDSPPPLASPAAREHFARTTLIVQRDDSWRDHRFAGLPEFERHRFQGVASVPVSDGGAILGIVNFCRLPGLSLKASELAFLLSLSLPLGALLSLPDQVARLTRQLADRKVIERAKGMLQSRFTWTEAEAYFHIRNASRQRRTPMREIALEVLEEAAHAA
jgi:hypothetical protein